MHFQKGFHILLDRCFWYSQRSNRANVDPYYDIQQPRQQPFKFCCLVLFTACSTAPLIETLTLSLYTYSYHIYTGIEFLRRDDRLMNPVHQCITHCHYQSLYCFIACAHIPFSSADRRVHIYDVELWYHRARRMRGFLRNAMPLAQPRRIKSDTQSYAIGSMRSINICSNYEIVLNIDRPMSRV